MINDHSQSKGDGWLKYFLYSQSGKKRNCWMGPARFSKVIIDCCQNHGEISYPYPKLDVCFLHRITREIIAGCASYDFESQKQSM